MSCAERADAEFVLTADEREQLLRWSHDGLALRAKIVLAWVDGLSNASSVTAWPGPGTWWSAAHGWALIE